MNGIPEGTETRENGNQPSTNTPKNCSDSNMNNSDITKWHTVTDLTDNSNDVYYVSKKTGESSWTVPEKGCIDPNSKWERTKNADDTWFKSLSGKNSVWILPKNGNIPSTNAPPPSSPSANQSDTSGRFAQIYKNIDEIRANLTAFNTTLKTRQNYGRVNTETAI
jgi:hypothetical protein